MAYTPGMIVADAVAANLAKASWIRRMFEEGARLKQERGADNLSIDVAPYREKRDLMYEGLTRIGYQCVKPQGVFYVFPRTPIADDVASVRLLAEEGVLTVPGSGFGMPGHIRISLTVERDTVVRALPGFARAFRKAR
jgi:aspartate aminotransferase